MTGKFCYWALRPNRTVPGTGKSRAAQFYLRAISDPSAMDRFEWMSQKGSPPATFRAFHDLFLDSLAAQLRRLFGELLQVGRGNEERIRGPHLEWAVWQTKHLIRSHIRRVDRWLVEVCDSRAYDVDKDFGQRVYWTDWRAPRLLIMKPSRHQPYELGRNWERLDVEKTLKLRESFVEEYVLHLEAALDDAASHAAVDLAKRPRQSQTRETEATLVQGAKTLPRSQREIRKRETQKRYNKWRRAYGKLKRERPDMSDVWYSRQIAKSVVGQGATAETIRKQMKK